MAQDEGEISLGDDLGNELIAVTTKLDHLEFQATLSGEYDERNLILAVHAGAGGTDSQDWVKMLMRMYMRWAEDKGYQVEVMDLSLGEDPGIKRVVIGVRGHYVYGYMKGEKGVHRLVRLSPFADFGQRHTSFALVETLPEAEEDVDVTIRSDDLRIDTYRAGGAGGQSVNKNSTAVRITHLPTGLVVTCQNERSQFQNKEYALKILRARLMDMELQRRNEKQAQIKGEHISPEFGNQTRSYVLHPYQMVKDHRTGYETSNTQRVLDGGLDELIQSSLRSSIESQNQNPSK
jgi:peptide chain release factor 2